MLPRSHDGSHVLKDPFASIISSNSIILSGIVRESKGFYRPQTIERECEGNFITTEAMRTSPSIGGV